MARTPGVGPVTFHRLLRLAGSPAAALARLPRETVPPPLEDAQRELAGLARLGAQMVASCEPHYPPLLAALEAPPPVLAMRGDASLAARATVALVGAREASAAGLTLARQLAADLGAAGVTVVSGLARGIDAAAHQGALASGTVAVLAGGLDRPYPPQNLDLHEAIATQGLVVSEAPLGLAPRGRDFPRRNHIISGMSAAVVVVEAAWRSGSLITARAAGEQGRDVMAAPGHPLDPRSRGGNALLKEGAALVETAEDILAVLAAAPRRVRPAPQAPLFEEIDAPSGLAGRLAPLLSPTPVHVNALAQALDAPLAQVAAALTELELEGRAATLAGGYATSVP